MVSIILKGCTQYLQLLDTELVSKFTFKNHYQAAADEHLEQNVPRSSLKLSAKNQKILCSRLVWTAWIRTLKRVDFERAFVILGTTNEETDSSDKSFLNWIFLHKVDLNKI